MRLHTLLCGLPAVKLPPSEPDEEICRICTDSRLAGKGCVFVCLHGPQQDGHAYAREAYERGCRLFVCVYPPALPEDAAVAYVPDSRVALAQIASVFYGYPERGLVLIGITGTKGKTTTAMMIYQLLQAHGVPAGYIGSNGVLYANVEEKTENTTPSAPELRRIFRDMRRFSIRVAVMEVSSQAIACERIAGLCFPICVFTNLAADHIGEGEHPDFSHYRRTKARLFSEFGCRSLIVNLDDGTAAYMVAASSATRIRTVSASGGEAMLRATHIRPVRSGDGFGTAYILHSAEEKGSLPVYLPLPGECNVTDALLALSAAREYLTQWEPEKDASFRSLTHTLERVRIPGRFTWVRTPIPDVDFVIDYAHNGYSLSAALTALRAYAPERLVCLFGSVGGRTYSRRTELAEAACAADFCIVTTDNPDTEQPADTMREICAVLDEHGRDYVALPDRAAAIRYAVLHARPGDMVLLAGKGHEDYQLICGRHIRFSEREILLEAAEEKQEDRFCFLL